MDDEEQIQREKQAALEDLLGSDGWKQVMLPQLRGRQREIERRCMAAQTLDAVRSLQGAWQLIENMLSAPHAFFGVRGAEPERKRD